MKQLPSESHIYVLSAIFLPRRFLSTDLLPNDFQILFYSCNNFQGLLYSLDDFRDPFYIPNDFRVQFQSHITSVNGMKNSPMIPVFLELPVTGCPVLISKSNTPSVSDLQRPTGWRPRDERSCTR